MINEAARLARMEGFLFILRQEIHALHLGSSENSLELYAMLLQEVQSGFALLLSGAPGSPDVTQEQVGTQMARIAAHAWAVFESWGSDEPA